MTPDDEQSLEVACAEGQLNQVRAILQELEVTTNSKSRKSKPVSALRAAVNNNHSSVVSLLMSKGFRFDYHCVKIALEHEDIATLQAFFDHKSAINKPLFHTMMPPLSHALDSEHLVHWFLDHGADPNASVPGWPSPMNIAAMWYPLSTIRLLRKHGGRVRCGVLQSAAKTVEADRVEVLEYLLGEGANINEVEYEWDHAIFKQHWARAYGTALHHAAKRGNKEIVAFLLDRGARQDIKDSRRKTPMQCALENGHDEIVATLGTRAKT
ncbi:MAG: hypothetical protein Q9225_004884 [Loekoesia sp. 1 TL-2023]